MIRPKTEKKHTHTTHTHPSISPSVLKLIITKNDNKHNKSIQSNDTRETHLVFFWQPHKRNTHVHTAMVRAMACTNYCQRLHEN